MNSVDIAILLLIGISVLTGLIRGFFKEIIALGIWILGFWLAYQYSAATEGFLQPYIHDMTIRKVSTFLMIVFCTVISGGILNALLSFILKRTGLSGTDRLLGACFGFVRGIFVVSLLMTVMQMTSLSQDKIFKSSLLYARFDPLVSWFQARLPRVITQMEWLEKQHPDSPKTAAVESADPLAIV